MSKSRFLKAVVGATMGNDEVRTDAQRRVTAVALMYRLYDRYKSADQKVVEAYAYLDKWFDIEYCHYENGLPPKKVKMITDKVDKAKNYRRLARVKILRHLAMTDGVPTEFIDVSSMGISAKEAYEEFKDKYVSV